MATAYTHIESNKRRSALLIGAFVVILIVMGYAYDWYIGGGFTGPIIAAVIAVPTALIGYFSGDKIALAVNRAHTVTKKQAPELHRIVENLAITAGVPKPKVYIISSPALNAFATGRDPQHASIAVTSGLLDHLDRSELEGVIAHELGHVKNYDIRLMMVTAIFVGMILLLADLAWRMSFFGGRRRDNNGGQAGAILAIVGLVLLILSPLIAKLIQLAVSRRREFLADASGVLLTRYPEGLASALEKIAKSPTPLRTANHATAHLFISNPFKRDKLTKLFSTHPPVAERISRLREMG